MISVGIDVSKEKSMICVLKPCGEIILSPYETLHTDSGLSELVNLIQSFGEEVRVILEATGVYHIPVLTFLKDAGIFVSVINPFLMRKYANTVLRKGKTDKLDAVRIANYGIDNWFKLVNHQLPESAYGELKMLGRQYAHYIKIRVQSKLTLTSILDHTMPEIKRILTGQPAVSRRDKLSDFVEKYWHYDNIKRMSEDEFVVDYCLWTKEKGYHASQTKAKLIHRLACEGITTLSSNAASTKMLTLEAVRILNEVNKTLNVILSQMQAIAIGLPEYETVRGMSGVGDVLAPRLIAEIGDVRRFHSGSALVAYAGIDAPPYQSGRFTGTKRNISKRGSALLRRTGYEVMKCLKTVKPKEDAAVYLFMLKKESEGKAKNVAKIAGLNKFLRIYYARAKLAYSA
jgi:transposase